MGLFKEIHCAHCGKKTNLVMRKRLKDDQYVCSSCTAGIPSYINLDDYDYPAFQELKAYLAESENELKKMFRENHEYSQIHLDTEHSLFYVGEFGKHLYLKLENLEEFELEFIPDQVKEGFLNAKVTGKVMLRMKMAEPYFFKEEVLDYAAKASAEVKGIFNKKAVYSNPKGMDEFLQFFNSAWRSAVDRKYGRLLAEMEQNGQNI